MLMLTAVRSDSEIHAPGQKVYHIFDEFNKINNTIFWLVCNTVKPVIWNSTSPSISEISVYILLMFVTLMHNKLAFVTIL